MQLSVHLIQLIWRNTLPTYKRYRSHPLCLVSHLNQKMLNPSIHESAMLYSSLQLPDDLWFLSRKIGNSLMQIHQNFDNSQKSNSLTAFQLRKLHRMIKHLQLSDVLATPR